MIKDANYIYEIDCEKFKPPEIKNSDEIVTIIEQQEYKSGEIKDKIKQYIRDNKIDVANKIIMLKVSLVFAVKDYNRTIMINTNYNLIRGVAEALEDLDAKLIYIADCETQGTASYAFKVVKLKKYLKGLKRTKFMYLDEVPKVVVKFSNSLIENLELTYPLCLISNRDLKDKKGNIVKSEELTEKFGYIDLFFSLPKLKVNIFAEITLSVKNNMGLIPRGDRLKYHSKILHDMISHLYTIRPPDLVITDAIVSGMGQGPMDADPCKTKMLIAGKIGTAVDTACCYLMDHDPLSVKHLSNLKDWGYGSLKLDTITIQNKEYIDQIRDEILPFAVPDTDISAIPGIKAYIGKDACNPGCNGMMMTILSSYGRSRGWDSIKGTTIILGKAEIPEDELKKINKKKTIVYGNCAEKYKKYGSYYSGCPPNYLIAMGLMEFPGFGRMGINPWIKYMSISTWFIQFIRHEIALLFGARRSKKI